MKLKSVLILFFKSNLSHENLQIIYNFKIWLPLYVRKPLSVLINVISSETRLWKLYNYQLKLPELTRDKRKRHNTKRAVTTDLAQECPWIQHNQPREAPGFHLNDSTKTKKETITALSLTHFSTFSTVWKDS